MMPTRSSEPDQEADMTSAYDVIVVGARCAGSPTAMLLARKGYKVLVVDRATFPSDTVSTHLVHPPGLDALQRWGLVDRVRATGCPSGERHPHDSRACFQMTPPIVIRLQFVKTDGQRGRRARLAA
jgi:2-polyprenyl-6-methoxyphenol hydroxylase-like FAD-dependent oxidoreductase